MLAKRVWPHLLFVWQKNRVDKIGRVVLENTKHMYKLKIKNAT